MHPVRMEFAFCLVCSKASAQWDLVEPLQGHQTHIKHDRASDYQTTGTSVPCLLGTLQNSYDAVGTH